jgi:adenylate cyclase
LKGKDLDVGMFEIIWQESEDELTAMSPRVAVAPAMIKLTHGLRKLELTDKHSVLTLGRDLQNDVVVADRKASRMHARIERRRDKFIFVDHSSNGSWVTIDGDAEVMIRREELTLRGSGRVSFGHAYADDPEEILTFSCLD